MGRFELAVVASLLAGCHPTIDVRGIYVGDDGEGTFFPCDDPTTIVRVPDSTLQGRQAYVGQASAGGRWLPG